MKKLVIFILISTLLLSSTILSFGVNSDMFIAADKTEVGLVGIYFNSITNQNRMRLLIDKDGERYTYNIYKEEDIQQFPLQMGNGNYTVRIMENTEGNKYRTVSTKTIELNLANPEAVFLNSIQEINWDESMEAIKMAKALTKGMTSDQEKVNAIYNYITKNISYDRKKVNTLTTFYLPNIDSTLKDGQGICYDYSSLFASMLRSVGVSTKMVKGYTSELPNEYHAWNEVNIDGQWKVIDTTFDAVYVQANRKVSQFKDASKYDGTKFY